MQIMRIQSERRLEASLLGVTLLGMAALSGTGWGVWAQQKPTPLAAPAAPMSRPVNGAHLKALPAPPVSVSHASAQPVELRMKFKSGDINKYQMTMQANLVLPGQPANATTLYDTNLSMNLQQRVVKINKDGSAQVEITTLSGSGSVSGQNFKPDIGGKPSLITFDARNNIVTVKDLPHSLNSDDVTGKLFQSGALSTQGVYLPKQPVRIGDKWMQKVNIASLGKDNGGSVQTTFVRMEPVGLYQTARLRSLMKIPFMLVDTTSKTPVPLKGMLNMAYDSNLAVAEGKVVRSAGEGAITVVVAAPAASSPANTQARAASFPAGKLGDRAKAPHKSEPAVTPQKITVKLHLGNNLIMQ